MADFSDFESDSDDDTLNNIIIALALIEYERLYFYKQPCRTSILSGHDWVLELLSGNPTRIFESLRMNKHTFLHLCKELEQWGGLKPTKNVRVEEQVAIFLLTVGHSETTRISAERFQHSTATISKYIRKVLYALNRLSRRIIIPPSFDKVSPYIQTKSKYYPYFKNCIGAIDGTHVSAHVPNDEQTPYRGKNVDTTQNVMCACDFDMLFTFVMAGWEGTANDSRVFLETVSNSENEFPMPPEGKFYVVDSGYTNMKGFFTPYRGPRYHLKDFRRGGKPRGPKELFNYLHSSLRNVIKRCFGVLKNRFPILNHMLPYSLRKQKYFVIACCVLHNFIRLHSRDDPLFREYEEEEGVEFASQNFEGGSSTVNQVEYNITRRHLEEWARKRDRLAKKMWDDYVIEHNIEQ